ncbi:MAG: hypothetical protein MR598_08860 [Erysipelotrichaceae bacterium]|nr:hypothetical protein [Erysipelotrichaceae bacterium]
MKYKNMPLVENSQYSLVKYQEEYKEKLKRLKELNPSLADSVEHCPNLYSELSDHQCYMIFKEKNECVGAVYIGTSCDESNLEIKLQIDEEKIKDKNNQYLLIEELIHSLEIYFYHMKNIEINLLNSLELEKINQKKYERTYYFQNHNTFKCQNTYHIIITKLLEEIIGTEKNLGDLKKYQHIVYSKDSYSSFEDTLKRKKHPQNKISITDIFSYTNTVKYIIDLPEKIKNEIIFNRDGTIKLYQETLNCYQKKYYEITYHVNSPFFHSFFEIKCPENIFYHMKTIKKFWVEDNHLFTELKINNTIFRFFKEQSYKKITHISEEKNNTSTELELKIDNNQQIKTCNINFRIHNQSNGQISNTYSLKLTSPYEDNNRSYLVFSTNKRSTNQTFIPYCEELEENLTINQIDNIIESILPTINHYLIIAEKKDMNLKKDWNIQQIISQEEEIISEIRLLKEEIMLPHLKEILEKFINNYEKIEKNRVAKKRVKK